ncbi:MAG TPA: Zn-dependent hydrolase [Solirubrobacteraceae bacterium]|jgi:N-carbamoyl-L-amino-acid hydrolase|nr:Zn-dependent hydrolase [Solirubrobacteraceae bacterium]
MADADRAIALLRDLAERTSDEHGAQRVAWTDTWALARRWLREQLDAIPGVAVDVDPAGNLWASAPGESERFVIVGSHLDSVPDGGWLDGALGVVAGLEVVRALAGEPRALGLRVVDWADEEGARFGRSLFGSSAAAGTLDPVAVRGLTDRDGVALPDALAAHGVDLERAGAAQAGLDGAVAYLELHIEQGPVLERLGAPLGVVLGTFGVERHRLRFTGAHAHAGATPMDVRRDAFLAAARSALAFREDAARRSDARATTGSVTVEPGIPTAFNGVCELTLDQRALDATVLAELLGSARRAAVQLAAEEECEVAWDPIWSIEPVHFDPGLIELAAAVVAEVAGSAPRLPSGPLHDASEMARVVPSAMLFARSLGGVSHTNAEDSPVEDLALAVRALADLTRRVCARPPGES